MRIIYYYSKLNIGGAEKSTVRLLNKLNASGHDVTLLLRWNNGELETTLDKSINIQFLKKFSKKKVGIFEYVIESIKAYFRSIAIKKDQYDLAISGLFGYNPKILFKYIRASQYWQMLRNDVSFTRKYGNTEKYMTVYANKFDAYIGVSEYTTKSFCNCYPALKNKAYTVYNILPDIDLNKAYELPLEMNINDSRLRILTVCRIADSAKGIFRMVEACSILNSKYPDYFVWYVVGDGPDKAEMEKMIKERKLQDIMILCGKTDDPLPYYNHCDLVAVLSYHEGLCGVVNEAKLMEKPLISTRFSGINEQIINGKNGIIVDNSLEAIIDGFKMLFDNTEIISSMAKNEMPEELLDNKYKIKKISKIFNDIEECRQ